jgi:hypothetical protein
VTTDKKVVTYQIPMNMTRAWKEKDGYGDFKTEKYWPWTQKEYTITIPYAKSQLSLIGIDLSQRMADVNPADNFVDLK